MKLFTRYNRVNVMATVATFIIGAVGFYFLLSFVLNGQLDDTLRSEQQEVVEYVATYHKLPPFQDTRQQWITYSAVTNDSVKNEFDTYSKYIPRAHENKWIRRLTFTIRVENGWYRIEVNRSEAETEDLLNLIIMLTLGMIGLILVFNFFINRLLVNKLWQPFYDTIGGIKKYYMTFDKPMQLPKENIDEINVLNESLNEMTARIYREYQALKSFTENASHEMQTPLAVIRGKLELLLQSDSLGELELKHLSSIEEAAQKLARLHQSLLLLTKIENRQFNKNEKVDLEALVRKRTGELMELFLTKQLSVETNLSPASVSMNPHLSDILVGNLLTNALRYTPNHGTVLITLDESHLAVSNTATGESLDREKVFRRFYKATDGQEGTGLGLAIIKEIAALEQFDTDYRFAKGMHVFTVYFKKLPG